MKFFKLLRTELFLAILLLSLPQIIFGQQTANLQTNPAKELVGLWEARSRFGPDVRGTLIIRKTGEIWQADIAGYTALVKPDRDSLFFDLADGKGGFQGKFDARRVKISGHWIQPRTISGGFFYASPVTLIKIGSNIWRGEVVPLDDEFTFYLKITPRDDGTFAAFFKNPERNLGKFIRVDRIVREGTSVKLFAADTASSKGKILAEGKYDAESETMSFYLPRGNGSYDFRCVAGNDRSDFYPRERTGVKYVYTPPPALDDGWQTASLESVGISPDKIEKFIQTLIDTPIDSVSAPEIHGVLIARHGKLVLEEYFHGENRDKPHDTRSAAKSLTATLFGAAEKAGYPVSVSTPVYQAMNGGEFPSNLDERKKILTVENLLLQNSGLDCDDADDKSPGSESYLMDESGATDYYRYTLDLKMIRPPGEKSVYCSIQPNLIGGVLQRVSKESLPVLFQKLLAEPLQIKRYYLNLAPNGDAYLGGGARFLPRDFIKLGQLYLNGGVWNGRRILTGEWTRRAVSPITRIGNREYGFLWWLEDFPYKNRMVRAFLADGNGGQYVVVIPKLDLVIAFYGGNYADAVGNIVRKVYIPQYILPTVEK